MAILPSNYVVLFQNDCLELYPTSTKPTRWELFKAWFTGDLTLTTRGRMVVRRVSTFEGRPAVTLELHGDIVPEKPSRYDSGLVDFVEVVT